MGRFRGGLKLLGESWQVLKKDPELLVLTAISLVFTVGIFGGFFLSGIWHPTASHGRIHWNASMVWLVPVLVVGQVVGTFVSAAIIGMANIRLDGGDPTLRDGLRIAARNFPRLLGWSLFASTVGFVIRTFEERLPLAGRISAAIAGIAWQLATVLVIPVLLSESVGILGALKRSATLFKQRWGEEVTGMGGIAGVFAVFMLPVAIVGGVLIAVSPAVGIGIIVTAFVLMMVAAGAVGGIFTAALYRYAVAGEAAGPFTEGDMRNVFPRKPLSIRRWWRRRRG